MTFAVVSRSTSGSSSHGALRIGKRCCSRFRYPRLQLASGFQLCAMESPTEVSAAQPETEVEQPEATQRWTEVRHLLALQHQEEEAVQPVPLFVPRDLPCTSDTGEQVAYQIERGKPWRLMGPDATELKWRAGGEGKNSHRFAVSQDEKARIKQTLAAYAEEHGVVLEGDGAVKIALLYGNYWVSWAGGVSIWTNPQQQDSYPLSPPPSSAPSQPPLTQDAREEDTPSPYTARTPSPAAEAAETVEETRVRSQSPLRLRAAPRTRAATCSTPGCCNLCLPYCERCKELQRFAPRSPRSRSPC